MEITIMSHGNPLWKARHVALASLVALGCGGGQKGASDDQGAAAAAAAAAAGNPAATAFTGQPVALQEQDVERFITVMREFKRLGLETRGSGDPTSSVSAMASAWGANREAMAILRDNDFGLGRFQQVTYSIMMAVGASEMEKSGATAAPSAAQLEAMKGKIPAAQYEAMKKTLEQASQMTEAMQKQPEGNVELVKRFRSELDALGRQ